MISRRSQQLESSGIRKVFELAAKIENPVNFSIGQPDFDVPEVAKEVAIEAIRKGMNRYTVTQGIDELRQKVLDYVLRTRGKSYQMSEVMITSGVSGGLMLALLSILDPGDEVIIFDPYFVMYKHLVHLLDGKAVIISTYPDFRVPLTDVENAITSKTKAIIINSPSNPTGYVYAREDIEGIVRIAKKHDILLITDEIYDGFVYDGDFVSPVGMYDKLLLLGGFSKTYAMTGWRLGYAVGPSDLIATMIKLQQYSFVCAPAPFQYAAVAALDLDMTSYFDAYKRKRDMIYEGLKDSFHIVKPGGAFYMFPGLKKGKASEFVEMAIANKVLIIPGNVFSEQDTHFRISFATKDETIAKGVEILKRLSEAYYAKVD
ncbi:pyridoxal phosphate-dependent aminotransferase [Thermospira aquatica]|uniref:Aminotransferase n=1 Tax=Thermospira aquatica TaxID=2828656 RepID=A0AAX3BDQ0_9SPIR|nr:pyridoxal phosphate-dependent aminotransferase [Thermospira aquatica]URA10179.1 pyridoxal phosphate-dependent aminotransferase [Thermospira aquatica]